MIRLAIAAPDLDEYQTLAFDGAIVVGRADHCNLVLQSRGVSSSHCRLTMVPGLGGAYMLEDLRSTYGTMVNGHPVTKPVVVSDRDVIAVGGHCFLIVGSGGDTAAYARLQEYRVALSVSATPSAAAPPVPTPPAEGNVATVPQFGVDASWAEKYAHFDKLTRAWHEAGRPQRA
ncbi:MAG: FHA domain-containing protein [Nannocystaceae bacterium]|nr:FHA domain-containing protein [Nannocystaceae bacterium]